MDDNYNHSICHFPACQRNYEKTYLRKHLVHIRQKGGDENHPFEDGLWVTLRMSEIGPRKFCCPFGRCSKVYLQKHCLKTHLIILRHEGGDALHPHHDELWNDPEVKLLLSIVPRNHSARSTETEKEEKLRARRERCRQKLKQRLHPDNVNGMYIYSLEY